MSEGHSAEIRGSELGDRGFTLIEILIVIAIIGIVIAFAVPNLLRAKRSANAASAIASLRTITTAESLYENRYTGYGTLTLLTPEGTLDTNLSSGYKSGYSFTVTVTADLKHFSANADPLETIAVLPHYFVDESAIIRVNTGAPAAAGSTPIQYGIWERCLTKPGKPRLPVFVRLGRLLAPESARTGDNSLTSSALLRFR